MQCPVLQCGKAEPLWSEWPGRKPQVERTGRAPPLGHLGVVAEPGVHCSPGQFLELPGQLSLGHLTCHGRITLTRSHPSWLAVPSQLFSFDLCPCQPGLNYIFSPPGHRGPFPACSSPRCNLSPCPSPNAFLAHSPVRGRVYLRNRKAPGLGWFA